MPVSLDPMWWQIIIKMGLVVATVGIVCQFNLSHQIKAWLWRFALIWVVLLPLTHANWHWLELAWIQTVTPLPMPSTEPVVSGIPLESNATWLWWVLIPSALGLVHLGRAFWQLRQMHLQATPITQTDWVQLNHQLAQQMNLKTPEIKVCSQLTSPCTWGLFKPVIAFPHTHISAAQREAALLHEMTHIKRHDWLWLLLSQILTRLFWFNPCVWWLRQKLLNSQEQACDEQVLYWHVLPSDYAATILQFHNQKTPSLTTAMAQPSHLYQRLQHILNPRRKTMKKTKQRAITGLAISGLVLLTGTQITTAHEVHEHAPTMHTMHAAQSPTSPPEPAVHPDPAPSPSVDPVVAPTPSAYRTPPSPPTAPDRLRAAEAALAAHDQALARMATVPRAELHAQRHHMQQHVEASRAELRQQREALRQHHATLREQQAAQQNHAKQLRMDSVQAMKHMEKALAKSQREVAEMKAQMSALKAELDRIKAQQ